MIGSKKILGFIPARGGSKGLPRKNIKLLSGKPLIAWTIEEARKSAIFDRILVSTDDEEIAEVARAYGADVPFIRPKELATDEAKGIDVFFHAVQWLRDHGETYDLFMLLQPTSPLRIADDIMGAVALLQEKQAKAVVSVCECDHPPFWMNTLGPDLCMKDFLRQDVLGKSRQELPVYYQLNGAVYVGEMDYLQTNLGFFGDKTYAYIMPRERSVDIDTEIDFLLAQVLMDRRLIGKG
ncbi:MAG TPA: acylneuraminate cytidylyltransferase family protein [Firmicutes bacterium]|jgi:CMP-N,N'-diacetyllegionaminic acid synthase|nr:acylneuraminate cytidylyltransferase family protein [Bacillota bacterium]HOQ23845.1 acylneuraminate cytidylyltransferase family protein [Bacillota bacterium]HPT66524.1 acylneuraminate cytidylyltransferase family protein [Bacillota bacterium]